MSIENPRQEASEPRPGDIWRSPTQGTWTLDETGAYVAMQPHTPSGLSEDLPADAVKLGDVEALRRERDAYQSLWESAAGERDAAAQVLAAHLDCVGNLERERDALRADIRVVLDSRSGALRMGIVYANESALIKALRLILDREPGREEPPRCPVRLGDDGRQCVNPVGHVDDHFAFGTNATEPTAREEPAATWRCARCDSDRWVGWRAGPEHEGYPRKAQCVPCGTVQDLPPEESE